MTRLAKLGVSALLLLAVTLLTILAIASTGGAAAASAHPQTVSAASPAGQGEAYVRTAKPVSFDWGSGLISLASINPLPAGAYVITAKGNVQAALDTGGTVTCFLTAENDRDTATITLFPKNRGEVTLEMAHTYGKAGSTTFSCYTADSKSRMSVDHIQVVALHVSKVIGS